MNFVFASIYYGLFHGLCQVDDKNLGPGPYYDRWQRMKQTEKLRESLEDSSDVGQGDGSDGSL